jgi:hypothetical protein
VAGTRFKDGGTLRLEIKRRLGKLLEVGLRLTAFGEVIAKNKTFDLGWDK